MEMENGLVIAGDLGQGEGKELWVWLGYKRVSILTVSMSIFWL